MKATCTTSDEFYNNAAHRILAQLATTDTPVTSHNIRVVTGNSRLRMLHNSTFAYVAWSRPEYDLGVFTDDTKELVKSLSCLQEKHKALSPEQIKELAKTA
jgi:hypothetical protein